MKKYGLFFILALIATCAFAEFRIWRDQKGNSIEAELLSMNAAQVAIRDRNGKVFKFNPKKLSQTDQQYLKTAFPPKMDVEFKKHQDRRNGSYNYSATVIMSGEVVITKKEQRDYSKSLKVVLLMIARSERHNDFIIADRAESEFDFKNSREFNLTGNRFSMYEDKYDNTVGCSYVGYLAVVMDENGNVLETKSSRKDFVEKVDFLVSQKKNTRFMKDFTKSVNQSTPTTGGALYY